MNGTLFVVATPIGNLGDITLRAIDTLKESDIIACEDTRHSEHLMRHIGIKKHLIRYDEFSHDRSSNSILDYLKQGKKVCLITDAGTPAISDPGTRLVARVLGEGGRVIPIPGASSVTAALSAAGIAGDGFIFLGFLPRKKGPAERALQQALGSGKTVVLLESPFRVLGTLTLIEQLAPSAHVTIAREMTKIHEEFVRGEVGTLRQRYETQPKKGEHVILIAPIDCETGKEQESK